MSLTVSVDVSNIAPYFGIGHNLSLICQPTSEDMKLYFIVIIIIIMNSSSSNSLCDLSSLFRR